MSLWLLLYARSRQTFLPPVSCPRCQLLRASGRSGMVERGTELGVPAAGAINGWRYETGWTGLCWLCGLERR